MKLSLVLGKVLLQLALIRTSTRRHHDEQNFCTHSVRVITADTVNIFGLEDLR